MKIALKLEFFREDTRQYIREVSKTIDSVMGRGWGTATLGKAFGPSSWVAEITGPDPRYRFARKFLKGATDYTDSNSVGSRGVFRYFALDEGHVYQVQSQVTWKRAERYYCTVRNGKIVEIDEEEVIACLNARSA